MRRHSRVLCCAAIVVALLCAAVLPVAAAPRSYHVDFDLDNFIIYSGPLASDGTVGRVATLDYNDYYKYYYADASSAAVAFEFYLGDGVSIPVSGGDTVSSSAKFSVYSNQTAFSSSVSSVLVRLLGDGPNGLNDDVIIGSVSVKPTISGGTISFDFPSIVAQRDGVITHFDFIPQATYSGAIRFFVGAAFASGWDVVVSSLGDPANPAYIKPDSSQLTDYIDREEAVNSNISGGLSSASNIFSDFGSKIQILLGGVGVFSNVISRLLGGVTELNTLVLLSLALGLFALLVGFVATVLRSPRSDAAKPPDKMVWYSDWHTQRKGRRK